MEFRFYCECNRVIRCIDPRHLQLFNDAEVSTLLSQIWLVNFLYI